MAGSRRAAADSLESALLFLGRNRPELARALGLLLPTALLEELARSAGRQRSGLTTAADRVADAAIRLPRFRSEVVAALLSVLPDEPCPPTAMLADDHLGQLRPSALLAALRDDLLSGEEAGWRRAGERLQDWAEHLAPPPAEPPATRPRPTAPARKKDAAARARKLAEEKKGLQARLEEARREISRLQEELGREHRRREALREELDEARNRALEAEARAAKAKRLLKSSTSPSEREAELARAVEEAQADLRVAEQKLAIVLEERDDLRACLEDHDRFAQIVDEEVPSFRDRPLPQAEVELAERLAERRRRGRPDFRVLVVGGGEPQLRHKDKFEEYIEILGIQGQWRMAEYTSWHKAIDTLSREMARSFDALIVLHWNRTTFTRRAREICNRHGQKPCLTCHYEGFVSLRQTLQECLRQLLAREEQD
ncbi:MAG: hypothetical protein D6702_11890 [Planctomycetota bacterium]|nr:MAG: hypothetical protein D6702_11890 [Planctomycetota bacterium]